MHELAVWSTVATPDSGPLIRDITDTALWVAAYRADETDRRNPLFRDPFARALAGERGAAIVANVKHPAVRYGVVLRTAVLDKLISDGVAGGRFDAVLNLAAGLDTRPYRLDLPERLRWIEVDMPDLIAYKEPILADAQARCRLERVSLDLSEREPRKQLFSRIAEESNAFLVITEGLLAYLEPEHVAQLAEDLRDVPSMLEWLTDISSASVMRGRGAGSAGSELKAEDRANVRFAPAENTAFFEPHGWREVEFRSLFLEAPRLGRDSLFARVLRGLLRVLPARTREAFDRTTGVVRLGRVE